MSSNRIFEYANRAGKKVQQDRNCRNSGECNCVVLVAILKRPLMLDCLLLLKQYRQTLDNFTLEFPIAVVGEKETPQEAAVRELEELTGYKGTVLSIGERSALDAGISNYTTRLVIIQINGGDLTNNNIRFQHRPHNNNGRAAIEVMALPVSDLTHRLSNFVRDGVVVDSRVEMYAVGLKTNTASTPTMVY